MDIAEQNVMFFRVMERIRKNKLKTDIQTSCKEHFHHEDTPDPWRFSSPDWIKPGATWFDIQSRPALSRSLDERPAVVPSSLNCSENT